MRIQLTLHRSAFNHQQSNFRTLHPIEEKWGCGHDIFHSSFLLLFFFLFCISYEDTEIDTRFYPVAWFCITRRWKEVSWDDTGARKVMLSIDHRHAMLHYSFFFFLYMWHFTTNTRALTLRLRWMCKETTNQTRISSARILFIFAQYMSLLYRTTKDHLCDSIAWFRVVYILTHRLL